MIVTPLLVAIACIGSLSIYYGRRSVHQLSENLMQNTTNRVQDQLTGLMQEPLLINRINASAVAAGELNPAEWRTWGTYFASQLRAAKGSNYIYAGSEQGYFVGSRIQNGENYIVVSDETVDGRAHQYEVDESGLISAEVFQSFDYDPRTRPWYRAAVDAKRPIWSDVYVGYTVKELLIAAAHPVYDDRNQLLGVLGTDLLLSEMNQFLDNLEIGKTGEVFIMERNGDLVSSSIGETVSDQAASDETGDIASAADGEETRSVDRISAFDSTEPVVSAAASHLLDEYGDLSFIQTNIRITRRINHENTFIAARPLRDEFGLEWLIVVVVPTRDFTGPLRTQTLVTLIVGSMALAIAIGLGWLVARWITRPILQLHGVAVDVKSQRYAPQTLHHLVQRGDEIGQFAGVFSEMAEIISQQEDSLEEQLKYMRLRAPMPDLKKSLDLSELRALQQKAKTIRETRSFWP